MTTSPLAGAGRDCRSRRGVLVAEKLLRDSALDVLENKIAQTKWPFQKLPSVPLHARAHSESQ